MRALRSLNERDRKLIRDIAERLALAPSDVVSSAVQMFAVLRIPGYGRGRAIT